MQKREAKVGVTLSHYLVMTQLAMTQLAMTQLAMTQVDDDVIQVDVKSASCFERLAFFDWILKQRCQKARQGFDSCPCLNL